MPTKDSKNPLVTAPSPDRRSHHIISRRSFLSCSCKVAALLGLSGTFPSFSATAVAGGKGAALPTYAIDPSTPTTIDRAMIFPSLSPGLTAPELPEISRYATYGYGNYTIGDGFPASKRTDIMPYGYNTSPGRLRQLSSFFSISDVHITDKESPNQLLYNQQANPLFYPSSSIYSPVMMYTTQVLDAVIQTINALHKKMPFDFGISLGDVCNTAQYNELRWYIDIIDGQAITPCSGDHAGIADIDYQKPFQAAGLDPSIPWYQTLGNHDHFWMGSFPIEADSSLGLAEAYTSADIMASGLMSLDNGGAHFPCLYDVPASIQSRAYYMGTLDGTTANGTIIDAGPKENYATPPTVTADQNRRHVTVAQWMDEFFTTTTTPVGHGFNLVDPSHGSGFACYSFLPQPDVPLKVIVLDNTQTETDGSHDIHGHGFLDATRWNWLQAELAAGQAADQLMIIAAHIPIGVSAIGTEMEWWESDKDPNATAQNAVSLNELVAALWDTPNLLMWISGHRHVNTVKAFPSPDPNAPEKGFWHVETASLRDFPQQFRTFQIYLNSDYTVSIVTTNVDQAAAEGTPAAKSRYYSIATQQILQTNLTMNVPNATHYNQINISSMDPSRAQDGNVDPTIIWPQAAGYGPFPSLQDGQYDSPPYISNAYPSYNAELFKQLSPQMTKALKTKYSTCTASNLLLLQP